MNTRTRRLLFVIGAAAAALALWTLAGPVAGADLIVEQAGERQTVGPVSVAVASLVVGLAAWALLAILERFTSRPGRIWTITAASVLVVSVLLGPLSAAVNTGATVALIGMHAVVAAVLIPGLVRDDTPVGRHQS